MKYVRMLGLAAVAALVTMASLGSGSASATVLCKTTPIPCPAGWDWGVGTEIHATTGTGDSSVFATTAESTLATCAGSTIKGKTTTTGSATTTVKGNIEAMTFTECTGTVDVIAKGEFEIHYVPKPDNKPNTRGELTVIGTTVTVTTFGVSCVLGTGSGTAIGEMTSEEGTEAAEIHVKAILPKQEGSFLCPGDVVWTTNYKFTSPKPLRFKDKMEGE